MLQLRLVLKEAATHKEITGIKEWTTLLLNTGEGELRTKVHQNKLPTYNVFMFKIMSL